MTIALGKTGKGTANDASSITANWTGGGTNTSGSTLLAFLTTPQPTTSISPTTPAGWTLRLSNSDSVRGALWIYEFVNASAIAGLTISYSNGTGTPVALEIIEFTGAGSLDSTTGVAISSSNGTTETTNGITTVAANTVLVAFFMARNGTGTTPRTLSTPGTGFTQTQSDNQSIGDTVAVTSFTTYDIVSATQSNKATTCARGSVNRCVNGIRRVPFLSSS